MIAKGFMTSPTGILSELKWNAFEFDVHEIWAVRPMAAKASTAKITGLRAETRLVLMVRRDR